MKRLRSPAHSVVQPLAHGKRRDTLAEHKLIEVSNGLQEEEWVSCVGSSPASPGSVPPGWEFDDVLGLGFVGEFDNHGDQGCDLVFQQLLLGFEFLDLGCGVVESLLDSLLVRDQRAAAGSGLEVRDCLAVVFVESLPRDAGLGREAGDGELAVAADGIAGEQA
ncbi:hypothetical protein ACFW9N_44295 [Streptomyces sp. NPDC059496]|uniref:hypothetical protein n=1 Tax=Streptomyces sp. NPDC059496 TaxID=3346851 RepID=UPI0036747A60